MSAKKYYPRPYPVKDEESEKPEAKSEAPEKEGKKYVLVYPHPIALGNKGYWPGEVVGQDVVNKMPVFLQIHFWEIGMEVEPRIYNKLAANFKKYFKPKHGG